MSEPRLVEETEVPGVRQLHPPQPQAARPPTNLAVVFQAIALVLAAKFQCLLLVLAMIVLSFMAVQEPITLRLVGAGGFDLLALGGIALLSHRQG